MRVAIVGLGSIGRRHADVVRACTPNVEIVAVRRATSGQADGMTVVHETSEAIARGLDAAIVATPATLHAPAAIALLRAGVPTLIEKPLAACAEDARAIAGARGSAGGGAAVAYVMRFHPVLRRVRDLVVSGAIGAPRSAQLAVGQHLDQWRPGTDYRASTSALAARGGGVLRELSHEIDLARWLLGPVVSVAARTRRDTLGLDVEDTADLLIAHEDGATASLHLDMTSAQPFRGGRVIGDAGTLTWDALSGTLHGPAGEERIASGERNVAFAAQWRAFLALAGIQARGEDSGALATVEDGVAALAVIEAAERAAADDRWEQPR